MATLSPNAIIILVLATISAVLGCGVMPSGQESTRTFNVTGFTTLPIAMVYSSTAGIQNPGIATNEAGARGFVERLVMQTVFDVLERQGRNSLLPDSIISAILGQLRVQVTYKPLNCEMVVSPDATLTNMNQMKDNCIVVSSTVTGICNGMMAQKCNVPVKDMLEIKPIPPEHLAISGTLSTTNIVMASWSKAMWENVLDRAVRTLTSGPFRSHFFLAVGTVSGN
ncbi:hypothetical protein KIN20_020385 [Parelaphostrongylus tenuis]|uniref:Uncharacterized protein n=1 Tax=Parelaphostrongylus tenuis TaxID=148309 RepID=A0AAD5MMD5_PARTN|nr:hypothetical protein KIN20_020385 [Parelaphostrongylus tenuis]